MAAVDPGAVDLTYSAGSAVALVVPGCALIFAETPSGEDVARCWPLVRDRAGVAAIVEALVSDSLIRGGLGSAPGFALACIDGVGPSVVLRGQGQALVSTFSASSGSHSSHGAIAQLLTADGLATWAECRLGMATTAVTIGVGGELGAPSAAPAAHPLAGVPVIVGGTVLVGSVTMHLGSPAEAEPPRAAEPPVAPIVHLSTTVQAVACPYGHLGPPDEPYCRICGTAIEDARPFAAERPPLGLLRLSTGDVIPLDRGVIMGRNPRATDERDADRPRLIRLPSPDNDVSRTHVEIQLRDWHVLVVDLGSTNGTTVSIPGQPPIRLRAHEPTALEPNAEVNLADEIVFRFEVPSG